HSVRTTRSSGPNRVLNRASSCSESACRRNTITGCLAHSSRSASTLRLSTGSHNRNPTISRAKLSSSALLSNGMHSPPQLRLHPDPSYKPPELQEEAVGAEKSWDERRIWSASTPWVGTDGGRITRQ